MLPQLICVIGAESTGKTTLTKALAVHYCSLSVPEYLREFCDTHRRAPSIDEQSTIIDIQVSLERDAQHRAARQTMPLVLCDTAPLLTAVYSDYVFADPHLYERAVQLHHRYLHTLLLMPDIEWVPDGMQRDGAHVREPITAMIRNQLTANELPFTEIRGVGETRLQNAIAAIDAFTAIEIVANIESSRRGAKSA
jgi:nicotinamide riboside kinase